MKCVVCGYTDAGDIQRSSNQSMACRVGQSQGQPVVTPSNRALDPFPELSHSCTPPSSTLYTGCFGEELTEEDDAVVSATLLLLLPLLLFLLLLHDVGTSLKHFVYCDRH